MSSPAIDAQPSLDEHRRAFFTPVRLAAALRASARLAIVGASLVLLVHEMAQPSRRLDRFVASNELELPVRNHLLVAMAAAAGVLVLAAWTFLLRKRSERACSVVQNVAAILTPAALLSVVWPLFRVRAWEGDPTLLAWAIAVVVLLAEQTVARALALSPARLNGWVKAHASALQARARFLRLVPFSIVAAAAVGYALMVTILTIRYHDRLGTAAFDLGCYDNLFYNALKGHHLRDTIEVPSGESWSHLRVHAEFSTFAFLPFYAIRPRAETLLCIQAFMVGLGALPVYLIAVRRLSRSPALLLSIAYLLFAPLHSGNFYDFHFQPLASTLVLWSFYFLETRRPLLFSLAFVVALGCREDVSLTFAAAGVLMLGSGYRPRAGLVIAIVSTSYFFIVRFVVMPRFGAWWFHDMYKGLEPSGDPTLLGVVKTVLSDPLYTFGTLLTKEKVLHVLMIFLPLAFLPLRKPGLWLGFVPAVLGTILTTGYHPTTDTTFQYVFYWVPFLFVGAIVTLQEIRTRRGAAGYGAALAAMTLATVLTSLHWGVVFRHDAFVSAWGRVDLSPLTAAERQTLGDLLALGSMVPKDAPLAVSEMEAAHFSNRATVYTLKLGLPDSAEYALYRTDSGAFGANQAAEAVARGRFRRVAQRGKFVLLVRNASPR